MAEMLSGSETSIICTPSSSLAATPTYVLEPIVNEVIPLAVASLSVLSSMRESVADMSVGSETSIICTPPPSLVATPTYVLEFAINEVIP